MTNLSKGSRSREQGFSLIEVLVSLLILGFGLLGLGGLQVASIKGTGNAHSRNVANMLAMELADRMRANPNGVASGSYGVSSVDCSDSVIACRNNTFCTAEQAAAFDLNEVMCGMKRGTNPREGGIANLLPEGNLKVVCPAGCNTKNAVHNITISWGERNVHQDQSGNVLDQELVIPVIP